MFSKVRVMIALGFAFSAPAFAQDVKQYSGSSCEVINGGTEFIVDGMIKNTTAAAQTLNCPIVRDGAAGVIVRAYVIDTHPTQNVSCYTSVIHDLTYTGLWSPVFTTSGVTPAAAPSFIDLPTVNGGSEGHFSYLTCTLPPRQGNQYSTLRSYFVREL
jgi:hypothetical protein